MNNRTIVFLLAGTFAAGTAAGDYLADNATAIAAVTEKKVVTHTKNLDAASKACIDGIIGNVMLPELNAQGTVAQASDVEVFRAIYKQDDNGNPITEGHIIARPTVTVVYGEPQQ